jgi:hypothetical protein
VNEELSALETPESCNTEDDAEMDSDGREIDEDAVNCCTEYYQIKKKPI